jgi:acyl-CoA thioesterase I
MPLARWSILLPLALAACGQEAPPAQPRVEASAAAEPAPVSGPERRVLAFGDSLFAGYGVDKADAYPAQLEAALRAAGVNAVVTNAGVSGDTSAAGRQRLAFTLDAQEAKPDLVILELGGNDLLRGISPDETQANFEAMLVELRKREIPVLLMGMRSPPNYGPEFQREFDALYPALAEEYGVPLVPFWLETIYRDPALFQGDRIHPTEQGIALLVEATIGQVQAALPKAE